MIVVNVASNMNKVQGYEYVTEVVTSRINR